MEIVYLKGEKLKNVPHGYNKDHPQAELLKYKSWYIEYSIDDEVLLDGDKFIALAVKQFKIMKPFNDFPVFVIFSFVPLGKRTSTLS